MKKKVLNSELLLNGFTQDDKKMLVKDMNNMQIVVDLDSNLFGNVNMINIYYYFKNELPFEPELLAGIWAKCEAMMNDSKTGLEIGALDTRWVCGIIQDHDILKDIHHEAINKYCEQFIQAIKPIIEEHNI